MSGGDARAELGVRPLLGVSGFLDPSQGFDVDLRGGSKGQGRSGIAGGEESWRRSELTGVEVSLQRSCAVVEVLTGGVGALLRLREPGRRGLGFWGGGGVE